MTYRNPPLLAERPEKSYDKTSMLPHNRIHLETISPYKQEETLYTEITTPLATMNESDTIPERMGLLINRNFAWLVPGAISPGWSDSDGMRHLDCGGWSVWLVCHPGECFWQS